MNELDQLNVDSIDVEILKILMKNARIECKAIANKIGVSDRTVARRIRKMEEKGIIKGYRVEINKQLVKSGLLKLTPMLISDELVETDASEWDSISSALKDIFGVASSVILFNIGLAIGKCYGKKLKEIFKNKHEVWLSFSQLFEVRGWGKLLYDEIDFQKGYGKITISRMPFKNSLTANIVRGIICGCLEIVCRKKVSVKQVGSTNNMQKFVFKTSE